MITVLSDYYPLLIPLAPLVAAALTALGGRDMSDDRYKMGWWAFVAGFMVSLLVLWRVALSADPIRVALFAWPWKFLPAVELAIDRLAAVMMLVISGIGTLLYRYSTRYLQQDPGQRLYQTMLRIIRP